MTRRTVTGCLLLTMAASGLAGCGGGDSTVADPTVSAASSGAKLTIGIPMTIPGVGMKSGDSYAGFDVSTAKYVAAKLGVPAANITWVEALPAQRETLLETGKADLVVSTYSITDQRKQKIDFAGPYFVAHQDLLIRRNDESIKGPTTLNGKSLCSVTNTTSAAYIKSKYAGKISLVEKQNYQDCVDSLVKGDVDAVTTDDLILAGFASLPKYKGILRVVGNGFTDERYGIGIKKGDSAMVSKVNDALKTYISDGSWKKALDVYVRPSGYAIPAAPTVGS